jgi:hypothetical protein
VDALVSSAGWGNRETINVALAEPEPVAEVDASVARHTAGPWRQRARLPRREGDGCPTGVGDLAAVSAGQPRN